MNKLARRERPHGGQVAPLARSLAPLRNLQNELDRLFEEPFGGWLTPTPFFEGWAPPVDVYEDKENIIVKAELPGMKKEQIEVFMSENMLHITGERKEEVETKEKESYRSERYFGRFERSIALPQGVIADKIQANYKDGLLTITCPKSEEAKRKQIEVKVS